MEESIVEVLVSYPAVGDQGDGVYFVRFQTHNTFCMAYT